MFALHRRQTLLVYLMNVLFARQWTLSAPAVCWLVMNKRVRAGPLRRLSHEHRTASTTALFYDNFVRAVFIVNDIHCFVVTSFC